MGHARCIKERLVLVKYRQQYSIPLSAHMYAHIFFCKCTTNRKVCVDYLSPRFGGFPYPKSTDDLGRTALVLIF